MNELELPVANNFLSEIDNISTGKAEIIHRINHLIKTDFEKIVYILYRVDVAEVKIKNTLAQAHGQDAAEIIYNLVSEREAEKILSRKRFKNHPPATDDEAW